MEWILGIGYIWAALTVWLFVSMIAVSGEAVRPRWLKIWLMAALWPIVFPIILTQMFLDEYLP